MTALLYTLYYDDSFVRVGVAVWIWKSSSEFDKNFPRWVSAVGWRTILIYPSWYIKGYQQQMIGEGNDIFLPVKCKRYSVRLFYIFGWKCWLNRIHLRWWWLGRTVISLSLSALSGVGFVSTFCVWTSLKSWKSPDFLDWIFILILPNIG